MNFATLFSPSALLASGASGLKTVLRRFTDQHSPALQTAGDAAVDANLSFLKELAKAEVTAHLVSKLTPKYPTIAADINEALALL